jgi:hypothetical protein
VSSREEPEPKEGGGLMPDSAPWGGSFMARWKGMRGRMLKTRKIINYETQVYEKTVFFTLLLPF